MLSDVHCHIYDKRIENVKEYVERAKAGGVELLVCCGSDLENSKASLEIAERFDDVYVCVGVHPEKASEFNDDVKKQLEELAKHKKVVAIGEIGLDYFYKPFDKDVQRNAFIKQIKLANRLNLPIVIHSREATSDMIQILNQYKDVLKDRAMLHCFNKKPSVAKTFIDMGFSFSIGGCLTFPNTEKLKESIKIIPLEKIMLETDAPYMSPVPFRGRVNYSENVKIVAQEIADLKGVALEEVESKTIKNAKKFFNIGER